MWKSILIFLIIIITQAPLVVSAQSFYALRRERNLIANFGIGTTKYYGDLVNPNSYGKVKATTSAGLEYFVTHRISLRTDLTWFQLSGDDKLANSDRVERNLSFVSNNIELNLGGAIQLFPNRKKFYQRPQLNVYAFAAVGILYANPRTEYQGKMIALQPLQTEGVKYSRFHFVIPTGLGVKLKVHPWMNIAVEGAIRTTFTDYLDDVSVKRYPDPATLSSDLSRALSDRRKERDPKYPLNYTRGVRGNPTNNDTYLIITAKLQYYLPFKFNLFQSSLKGGRRSYKNKAGMYKVKKSSIPRPKKR